MSLNAAQRIRTSAELHENLNRSGLDLGRLADRVGMDQKKLRATLDVSPVSRPEDVWMLRDLLEEAVRGAGAEPVVYSVLTEGAREDAARWFPLRGRS